MALWRFLHKDVKLTNGIDSGAGGAPPAFALASAPLCWRQSQVAVSPFAFVLSQPLALALLRRFFCSKKLLCFW